jgi:peptidoglycan/LPS O-acetylase OafA/YrhL
MRAHPSHSTASPHATATAVSVPGTAAVSPPGPAVVSRPGTAPVSPPGPAVVSPADTTVAAAPAGARRLAWLDAMRGIAALCVVYSHFSYLVLPGVGRVVYSFFHPGLYGVLVFFMISGYIVPASLERKGSIRSFWVSRVFRLFPLYAVAVAAALVLYEAGWGSLRGTQDNASASVFAHLFMLSDLLGGNDILGPLWTLSYEMVFYLLVTALFAAGLHRRSGSLATAFAAGALLLGGLLPTIWLSGSALGQTPVAVTADVLIGGGLAAAVAGRGLPRELGLWLAAGAGLVLVAVNERLDPYEGLTILALMFTGTLIYRAQQGQVSRWRAVIVTGCVFGAATAAGVWHIPSYTSQPALQQRQWVVTIAAVGVTFAAGLAARHLRVPRALAWLGLVSYSVYLLHQLLIYVYNNVPFFQTSRSQPAGIQVLMTAAFVAALLCCAAVSQRLVEAPAQRLGRRIAARLDARFGPDGAGSPGKQD